MKRNIFFILTIALCSSLFAQNTGWARKMGSAYDDICNAVAFDDSGNVYSTGTFPATADFDPGVATYNLSSNGTYDIFISKLNSTGNFVWAKNIGGPGFDEGQSIFLDNSGNVYLT
ncbi:MAG: hypothetical protein FGM41_05525 [Bacteroidetes bacterium]|nr:hypothetical protein [Bacteroidota bacterium]